MTGKAQRTEIIKFRVTPEEKQILETIAEMERTTLARLIREAVLEEAKNRGRYEVVHVRRADPELLRQIAKIGNNLNQIARRVNSGAKCIEVVEALIGIERACKELTHVE